MDTKLFGYLEAVTEFKVPRSTFIVGGGIAGIAMGGVGSKTGELREKTEGR